LLGALHQHWKISFFPRRFAASWPLIGQLGLVLFMFLIGLELNLKMLQDHIPLASRITVVGGIADTELRHAASPRL
jgi:Kef-type K+ transport system membrane component KefB